MTSSPHICLLVEANFIPIERNSQDNSPVMPSDPEHVQKGKGKQKRKSIITTKNLTPISTQRPRKPCSSSSIQDTDIISPVHLRELGVPRNQTEESRGPFRSRSSAFGQNAPPTPERPVPMKHGKQEAKPGFTPGTTWGKLPEDMSQKYVFQRVYENHHRLESQQGAPTIRREGSQDKGESSHKIGYKREMEPGRIF
ncbi:hypothetical protein O181_035497 [Austropuccinia psidii MF-1]|uniref:Uncharacterized protein n=1 Tax=Austropuccinia psidii MF-1 TaxID=1389203 RepID=A0A9Q3D8R5_9BASI|nr:hypothetical protein [Austropuccinia psidii MF-1]